LLAEDLQASEARTPHLPGAGGRALGSGGRLGRRRALRDRQAPAPSLSARFAPVDDGPINVADFERLGAAKLEQGPRDYFAGGAGDELTLRENVAAWGHWRLRPRVLNDVGEVSTAAEV